MPTKLTLKAATACHPLAKAVIRQLGGGKDAVNYAIDAANHGADTAFHGFTYYKDTVKFAERNKARLLQLLANLAGETGVSVTEMLKGWRSLKDVPEPLIVVQDARHMDYQTVMNALAWYALEDVGHAFISYQEG